MKRILITILIFATLIGIALSPAFGAVTNTLTGIKPNAYWWTGDLTKDRALFQARELEVLLGATAGTATASKALILSSSGGTSALLFTPTDTAPTATEGRLYYHDGDECLKLYTTSSGWVDMDVSGASSLGTAYVAGQKITLTSSNTVEIECPDDTVSAGPMLLLDCDEDTDNIAVLQITDDGAGICIDIDGTTGDDIQGTGDTWAVDYAGYGTFVGLLVGAEDIELESGAEIQNVVDTEIRFIEDNGSADEDFILDFGTNVVTLKSGTAVDELAMGDVDDLTGVGTIAFDAAGASCAITMAGSGAGKDLTIEQTVSGADASLILQSSGTGTDALSLISSVADIKANSADNIDIDAADNITINTADGSYTLTIAGSANGDYAMTAADTMSFISVDSATFQTTAAEADITVNSVLGSIFIEAEEDIAGAVTITADGGTSSTLKLHNDTGTGATSLYLLTDVGGITATASAGAIVATATGADAGDLTLSAGDVMTLTSADTKIFDGAAAETWIIEGSANEHEASVVFTDPTADVTYTVPVAAASTLSFMLSTLATNAPDIANSVTGGTSQLIFEGSDADTEETIIQATDPTADIIWILPDGGADSLAFMGSTLTTNYPEVENSIWGDTNKLAFEGSTANDFETWITPTNATADRTLTLPDMTGNFMVAGANSEVYSAVVEVSAAEIKALAASPKELVAAPGEGYGLKLLSCLLVLDNGATNYDDASADGNMYICYVDGDGLKASGSIEGDAFIDCTADFIIAVEPAALAATAATGIDNDALVLDNDGAEYTTGDGTMTVFIEYAVVNLGL